LVGARSAQPAVRQPEEDTKTAVRTTNDKMALHRFECNDLRGRRS
jgi:hypothetical protein